MSSYRQSLWNAILEITKEDELQLYVVGPVVVFLLPYWTVGLLYLAIDITKKPACLYKYKIRDDKNRSTLSRRRIRHLIAVVLRNQLLSVPLTYISYKGFKLRGLMTHDSKLPTTSRMLIELAAFVFFEEIFFYYVHRLLHRKSLFKWFHKEHHEWHDPIGLSAIYCHAVEFCALIIFPVVAGPVICGSHLSVVYIWIFIATVNVVNSHCGYHFPGFPSNEAHDYHHFRVYAELKPKFFKRNPVPLAKSSKPWERLSIDFKGPVTVYEVGQSFAKSIKRWPYWNMSDGKHPPAVEHKEPPIYYCWKYWTAEGEIRQGCTPIEPSGHDTWPDLNDYGWVYVAVPIAIVFASVFLLYLLCSKGGSKKHYPKKREVVIEGSDSEDDLTPLPESRWYRVRSCNSPDEIYPARNHNMSTGDFVGAVPIAKSDAFATKRQMPLDAYAHRRMHPKVRNKSVRWPSVPEEIAGARKIPNVASEHSCPPAPALRYMPSDPRVPTPATEFAEGSSSDENESDDARNHRWDEVRQSSKRAWF